MLKNSEVELSRFFSGVLKDCVSTTLAAVCILLRIEDDFGDWGEDDYLRGHNLAKCEEFYKAGFLMEVQLYWLLLNFKKISEWNGIKNYWYYSFQIQIKVKNVKNVKWKIKLVLKLLFCLLQSMVKTKNSVC